jgi:hypothetical protein
MSWPKAQRRNPIRLVSLWTAGRRTSVLIKRRHPEVQAEIDRVYQEHLAKLGKRRLAPATQDD